jgi:hypothetical protein
MTSIDWANLDVETVEHDSHVIDIDPPDITIDEKVDEPSTGFVKVAPRPRNAAKYEKKAASLLNLALRLTAPHDNTVADAAAIIQYGDDAARAIGILAAHDDKVAYALDWIDGGTENPYVGAIVATMPLVLQIVRNHEPILEPAPRGFRIPFLKDKDGLPRRVRIPIKLGIRLGMLRNATHDPKKLTQWVFGNADVRNKMDKESIEVAVYKNTRG